LPNKVDLHGVGGDEPESDTDPGGTVAWGIEDLIGEAIGCNVAGGKVERGLDVFSSGGAVGAGECDLCKPSVSVGGDEGLVGGLFELLPNEPLTCLDGLESTDGQADPSQFGGDVRGVALDVAFQRGEGFVGTIQPVKEIGLPTVGFRGVGFESGGSPHQGEDDLDIGWRGPAFEPLAVIACPIDKPLGGGSVEGSFDRTGGLLRVAWGTCCEG